MMNLKSWDDPTNMERNEIVFASRNHNYGAYTIRTNYNRSILKAFSTSVLFVLSVFAGPYIYSLFKTEAAIRDFDDGIEIILPPIKPEEIIQPPPPVKPPQLSNSGGSIFTDPFVKDSTVSSDTTLTQMQSSGQATFDDGDSSTANNPTVTAGDTAVAIVNDTVIFADVMPKFPGGESALVKFLHKNIKYPPGAREIGIEGTVYIDFVIDKNGWMKSPKIRRGVEGGCTEEALRVLSLMPQWIPGKVKDHPVNVQFVLPIKFRLE